MFAKQIGEPLRQGLAHGKVGFGAGVECRFHDEQQQGALLIEVLITQQAFCRFFAQTVGLHGVGHHDHDAVARLLLKLAQLRVECSERVGGHHALQIGDMGIRTLLRHG